MHEDEMCLVSSRWRPNAADVLSSGGITQHLPTAQAPDLHRQRAENFSPSEHSCNQMTFTWPSLPHPKNVCRTAVCLPLILICVSHTFLCCCRPVLILMLYSFHHVSSVHMLSGASWCRTVYVIEGLIVSLMAHNPLPVSLPMSLWS